jgi:hypothetical protein
MRIAGVTEKPDLATSPFSDLRHNVMDCTPHRNRR